MTATLSDESEEYVKARVRNGEYSSISDVTRAGLYLLEDQEALRQIKMERLRKEFAIGIEATNRGELAPLDVEEIGV